MIMALSAGDAEHIEVNIFSLDSIMFPVQVYCSVSGVTESAEFLRMDLTHNCRRGIYRCQHDREYISFLDDKDYRKV